MITARLMHLEYHDYGLYVVGRWKVVPSSDHTIEPIEKVYKDVSQMLERFLTWKNIPLDLAAKARSILAFWKRGV